MRRVLRAVFNFAGQAWAHINKMFIKLISDVIIASVGLVIPLNLWEPIDFDHATMVDKARNFHERLFARPGIRRETRARETNILTFRMFTNPSRNHAQHRGGLRDFCD